MDKPEDLAKLFKNTFPDKIKSIVDKADLICNHVFDLLGSGAIKLVAHISADISSPMGYKPIEWHTDFKSGYTWNRNTFFKFIRYGKKQGVDIKVPLELSRFKHLNLLGQAYILSRKKKYANEFQNQISDWIENNKVGFGVNWSCTMDVAIRAANWLVAMEYFHETDLLSPTFINTFFISIYEHARFIFRHLEYGPPSINHYISGITGLFFISIYCPFFYESEKWKRFCIKELEKIIENQVYDDGCSFEGSTSYHHLVLELLSYTALLAKRAGMDLSTAYHERLKKMFEFSLYCIKPNGNIPQIGDNDNGRFVAFATRQPLDHTYLVSFAAIYFEDNTFKMKAFPYDEEALWIFGKEGHKVWNKLKCLNTALESKVFPDAGWYIMRHRDNYCFISCGPIGQNGMGGHNHNDKLSFELMLNGEDIVVDPGTYVYTPYPEWRNKFRSTAFHNTVTIDNREQNDISGDLFIMNQGVECRNCKFDESDEMIKFEGELRYMGTDILHKRSIVLYKHTSTFTIFDTVASQSSHNILINLCLGNGATNYHISLDKGLFEETEGFFSNGYGKKLKTVFLRNTSEGCSEWEGKITIVKKFQ